MFQPGCRVLVTGASGFIGSHLCQELTSQGVRVTAMLRARQVGPWHDVIVAELGTGRVDPNGLEGVDTIFHLAGKAHTRARTAAELREYETVHVQGTRALLHAARQANVRAVVYVSSVKAMGEGGPEIWDEDVPCAPQNPYGITKLEAERLVLEELSVPCPVVLRPTLVYGAGSKGNLDMMIRCVRKGLFPAIRFPRNARSMIHVSDVVQACLLAATRAEACGKTFILTDGREYSTAQIFEWICEALGRRPRLGIPFTMVRAAAVLGDMIAKCGLSTPLDSHGLDKLAGSARYSNARICRELGFAPAWNLRDGIHEMAEPIR